jgi:Mrp family chromosome partitioning ATPase
VLSGACDLEGVLVPTGLPNLTLLPAGKLPGEGREAVVRGARLRETIDQLAERFEHLVLDVPAVAATSDAIPLARLGTGVLLVVRQGVTPRRVVAAALDDLSTCNVLGVVLNRAKIATPRFLLKFIPQD